MKKDDFNEEKLDIEIPYEAAEMLLNYAAETELSVEEILESAIKKHLEMMKNG